MLAHHFLIFFGLCSFFFCTSAKTCSQLVEQNLPQSELIGQIDDYIKQQNEFTYACLETLIKRSYYEASRHVIGEYFIFKDVDISDNIRATTAYMKKELDGLLTLVSNMKKTQIIYPVLKWSQNASHVFVYVKFAHRHDSPGCLEVFNENMKFTNKGFNFSAFGIQAHSPLEFLLEFELNGTIVEDSCSWQKESVGTMTITMKKDDEAMWRSLGLSKYYTDRHQVQLWWEMRDKHKEYFDKFLKMIEDEEDQTDVFRKKRKNKNKNSAEGIKQPIESSEQIPQEPGTAQEQKIETNKEQATESEKLQVRIETDLQSKL